MIILQSLLVLGHVLIFCSNALISVDFEYFSYFMQGSGSRKKIYDSDSRLQLFFGLKMFNDIIVA